MTAIQRDQGYPMMVGAGQRALRLTRSEARATKNHAPYLKRVSVTHSNLILDKVEVFIKDQIVIFRRLQAVPLIH